VKAGHLANAESPTYRKLIAKRKQIYQIRESIAHHRKKLWELQAKLKKTEHRKEELELAFGQERAARKRKAAA
jgi:hypothetical protein